MLLTPYSFTCNCVCLPDNMSWTRFIYIMCSYLYMKLILDWIIDSSIGIRVRIFKAIEESLFYFHLLIHFFCNQLFLHLNIVVLRTISNIYRPCNQESINWIWFHFYSSFSYFLIKSMSNVNVNTLINYANLLGSSTKSLILLPGYYNKWVGRMKDYLNWIDEDVRRSIKDDPFCATIVEAVGTAA